jgi:GNAT superfamily N-acetyltransferase
MTTGVRQAQPGDAEAVAAVLREAAQWLTDTGRPPWRPADFTPESLATGTYAGEYFIASDEAGPAGVVRLVSEDPLFWPDVPPGEGLYLHKLAVARRAAGRGVSDALLAFASARAAELGRAYVRLDCAVDRPALRQVYERRGFRFHSHRTVGAFHVARYERPVGRAR